MNDTSGSWNKALQTSSRICTIVTLSWMVYVTYLSTQIVFYPMVINGMKVEIPANNQSVYEVEEIAVHTNDDKGILHNQTSSEKAYMTLYFLPFGDWPFLDTTDSPAYELVYFLQGSGCIIHGIVHSCADTLFFVLVTLVCGQFEALISTLKILGTSKNYSEVLACIHQHQHLLRTVEMINALYSPIMLIYFFNAMLALCAFAFEASKMEGDGFKIWSQAQFFFGTTIQAYMFCSAGGRLTSLSSDVADSIYESDWVDKPKLWKQSIEIIIMRAQKPVKLIGGPFYVISKETFLALMQMSFSYYTVLCSVQKTEE